MVPEQPPPQVKLTTWQEIAAHLGVSVRTAQKYEQEQGLPVLRTPGIRGRIVAYPTDIDRWNKERLRQPQARSTPVTGPSVRGNQSATPQSETTGRGATPVVADAPAQQNPEDPIRSTAAGEFAATNEPDRIGNTGSRRPVLTVSWAAVAGFTLLGGLLIHWIWPAGQPAAYRVEVGTLIAVDGGNREVWRHEFPKPFADHAYEGEMKGRRGIFADLDNNGKIETLFTYVPVDWNSRGSELLCFSPAGKERWRFRSSERTITDNRGEKYFPPYWISNTQVIPAHGHEPTRIVISSNHHMDAPNQVVILNSNGKLLGEYWHPGHLLHMAHADINQDGKEELLIAGVNNAYHEATLLVFDPADVHGTSIVTGSHAPGFGIKGLPPGTEKAVVFFPRTCISRRKPYNRVGQLIIRGNYIYAAVAEDTDEGNPAQILYKLNFSLNVLAADPLPGHGDYQEIHHQMYRAGELDHELTREEMERWKSAVIVRRQ